MRTTLARIASVAGAAFVIACSVGTLFDSPPTKVISVTPPWVAKSLPAGSNETETEALVVSGLPGDPPPWTADGAGGASWLTVLTAPDTVGLVFDPSGLDPGVYRETVVIVPHDHNLARVHVPVELRIVTGARSLMFSQQPTNTAAGAPISPPVEVTALDDSGNVATGFTGNITVAIEHDGSPLGNAQLSGVRTVAATAGVARFSDLRIDQVGTGYTLVATASGLRAASSVEFDISLIAPPPPPGIALWGAGGTLTQSGTRLGKEFNPQNPPPGSTVIATFVWVGSSNVIDSVADFLWSGRRIGNRYNLVEYVTAGGISMATYVATNVQNYPYPRDLSGNELVINAYLSTPVSAGGALVSAFTGVDPVFANALGAHRSATGSGSSTPTNAHPGAIPFGAGALVYGVSMASDGVAGRGPPTGFSVISNLQSASASIQFDVAYAVQAAAGSVDPVWGWSFTSPNTWLASAFALKP